MALFHLVLTCALMFVGPIACGLLPLMFAQPSGEAGGVAESWVRHSASRYQHARSWRAASAQLTHNVCSRSHLQLES